MKATKRQAEASLFDKTPRGGGGRQGLFMALTALLCLAVLAAGVLLCVNYYSQGRNLRDVDMRKYAKVEMEDEVYTVSVDADAIVKDFHLPNPKTTNLDLSRFPDVETVYSLTFLVTPRQEGGWSIQTGSDRPTAAEDLRRGGLRLVNTEWTWTEQDMKNAYRDSLEYPRRLSMKKYVLCGKNTMGGYVLTVDHERMLRATGWDLPEDESVRKAHTGYKAIVSLGYYVSPLTDGFLVETSSTLENVYAMLLDNGVRLTDTTWVYSLAEVEELYAEQHGAQEAESVPESEPEPGPVAEANGPRSGQVLTSLYHVDQTPVRKAIRQAKEQKYGATLKSSEVVGNCFVVAKTDEAEHGNVFRLVYEITTTGGKEYLVADAFDLQGDGLPMGDVQLTVAKSQQEALSTDAFDASAYTVHVLTEGAMVYAEDGGASPFDADGLLFPNSLTERIAEADMWSLAIPADKTLLQLLGYGRNEIFARCGNKFSDTSAYTRFYSNYPWYQPKGSVSYNTIKAKYPVAAENIESIKAMEKLIKEG